MTPQPPPGPAGLEVVTRGRVSVDLYPEQIEVEMATGTRDPERATQELLAAGPSVEALVAEALPAR